MPGVSMFATSAPRPPVEPPPAAGAGVAGLGGVAFNAVCGVATLGAGFGFAVGGTGLGFTVEAAGGGGASTTGAGFSCTTPTAGGPAGAAIIRTMIICG